MATKDGSAAWDASEFSPRCSVTLQIILSFLYRLILSLLKMTFCKLQEMLACWHIVLLFPARWRSGSQLSFPRTGAVNQYFGGYISPAPWQEAAQPFSKETSKALCVCICLCDCSKRMMKVHRILLLISAGKGVLAIALNRGQLFPECARPSISMGECVLWEQPVLLIRFYEHTNCLNQYFGVHW